MTIGIRVLDSIVLFALASGYWFVPVDVRIHLLWFLIPFTVINLVPSYRNRSLPTARLRICADGCELLRLFLLSTALTIAGGVAAAFRLLPVQWTTWGVGALVAVGVEAVVFWNGILRVYATSVQLGIRWRILGLVCGLIPFVNLWVLSRILRIATQEVIFEADTLRRDQKRKQQALCRTRYPILLVHGVFFRDYAFPKYWGRIPAALERNGAQLYYGKHQSAAAVCDSARELTARIREIVETTGCGKVNIIAHSKGGLDCRYALTHTGAAPYVASLTTINTPHRGCLFADYLLEKIPLQAQKNIAAAYNATMRKLGDPHPDFMAAVRDLTASACAELNAATPDVSGVVYRSIGSRLVRATGGKFPLNFSYALVKHFDGSNDGLVAESSFPWGEQYTLLTPSGPRGISHGDMIDLNRENIPGFDVREFYVALVSALRERGL